ELMRLLRADGLGVGDPFPVTPGSTKPGISDYFAQDEGAAIGIGHRLQGEYGDGRLVHVPRNAGQPRPGTIEIAVGSG
ncbi:MAG TPA: hypothetical protein VFW75_01280, partial [Acetobacteraceae bacterium]|nr:hypothetical protein [Acetobacteraceae bacterium]